MACNHLSKVILNTHAAVRVLVDCFPRDVEFGVSLDTGLDIICTEFGSGAR
jgi:hypothetical protein